MRPGPPALAGAALLVLGMALVFASVAGAPLFRLGTVVLAVGFVAILAAGVLRALPADRSA